MNIFYKDFITHIDIIKSRCWDIAILNQQNRDFSAFKFVGITTNVDGKIVAEWESPGLYSLRITFHEEHYYISDTEWKEFLNQLQLNNQ